MADTALAGTRGRPTPDVEPFVELAYASTPPDHVSDTPDIVRLLANRLVATLDSRPFRPTVDQLAWVWGGELGPGETGRSRARIAAYRYAELFAGHVIQDVTVEGGVGAYMRIWQCARRAFIDSVAAGDRDPPRGWSTGLTQFGDAELSRWENEGGASLPAMGWANRSRRFNVPE
ncbi:MAG TPA: hypothetical protein VF253_07510 [Candidatus Limnocylindrales bacterium]